MSYIKQEDIFEATNGGLDIILSYFPEAHRCVEKPNEKFKIRGTEKTASANLRQVEGGVWLVTDFGGDAKPKNAIQIVREEEKVDFYQALQLIAERFNIAVTEQTRELMRSEIIKRLATEEEEEGKWIFKTKDFTEKELEAVFADQVRKEVDTDHLLKVCATFNFFSLESYTIVKNREATEIRSTDHYPIFMWEIHKSGEPIKYKLYQPKAQDKGFRFMYHNGRPEDHVFGLKQCVEAFERLNKVTDPNSYEKLADEEKEKERKEKKLPEIILCTGGSDAMNVYALGYQVVWLNSETAKLTGQKFSGINKLTEKFCILYDIDATGRRQAHDINMVYLDLHQIKLPAWLLERRDWRGNPCKDVRDFLRMKGSRDLKKLVDGALPYKFWDTVARYDKKGNPQGSGYECNNEHLYHFLSGNGFYQLKRAGDVDIFIKISGNTVEEVKPKKIRHFIKQFLIERGEPVKLRNMFYNTTRMNASSLENLPFIELDFTDCGKDYQLMFFENATWKITAQGIKEYRPGEIEAFVWQKDIIAHKVKLQEDIFKIDEENDDFSIDVLNRDGIFFQFLINTCKVFWTIEQYGRHPNGNEVGRTELTKEEQYEQDLHLINRIFTIGYSLHKYKDDTKTWAPWHQEFKTVDESVSDGGSGKSIVAKFPRYFMNSETYPARDPRMTDNKHLLEKVTEYTGYVLVDDAAEYMNFGYWYPMITGEWTINPKNTSSFTLSYKDGPKIAFTSNFAPRDADPSTMRRILFSLYSDYYHHGPSDTHPSAHTPFDEFKMQLFTDFDEQQWNHALNFGAQCLRFFLSTDRKVDPPMDNVNKRNLLAEMGNVFKGWADVFFSFESGTLNTNVVREEAQKDFFTSQSVRGWSSNKFGKALRAWSKYYGFKLNPKDLCNDTEKKRIIAKVENPATGKKKTEEMIYIQTQGSLLLDEPKAVAQPVQEKMPF
ncbi:MAG: hypothetical protein ACYC1Q_07705 [Bacteroidia bacterium]